MGTGLVVFIRRVAPSLPLYGGAAALLVSALGLWWWAERDARLWLESDAECYEIPPLSARMTLQPARPLLKWAGGKRQLLPQLRRFYPSQFSRYIEPFFGSGAVFFDLHASGRVDGREAVLIDSNPDLIGCYTAVRDAPDTVADALDRLAASHARDPRARTTSPCGTRCSTRSASGAARPTDASCTRRISRRCSSTSIAPGSTASIA